MARTRPIVAIDGPAGAGKSTVARRVADALGFVLVDTGAIYRVVALGAERRGIAWSDAENLGDLARELVQNTSIRFEGTKVMLANEDVSVAIRTPQIGMGASQVSAHAEVRAALLDLQRQAGKNGGVVLEGRDIGTVVFPDAEVKVFLTASPEVRASRRYEELVAKGNKEVSLESTLDDVKKRDAQDTGRAHAPLRQAEGATLIDSSSLTIDEVVEKIARLTRGDT
ncbi:MAG: (d)CMP kinase [Polyangiaceae bacterium]